MSLLFPHSEIVIEDWDLTHYKEAFARQQEKVLLRQQNKIKDTLIFTEHYPVYTIGASKNAADHLLLNEKQLAEYGIEVEYTNRGGDITYHGPGQIVGYPIINLQESRDLHTYLRYLEQVIIEVLAKLDIQACRREKKTGVWVENRKIAAMGIAVKQWVTYHGFALNVNNDISAFSGIIPCGIPSSEGSVTSVSKELNRDVDMNYIKDSLIKQILKD